MTIKSIAGIDHAVVAVKDLDAAAANWKQLGFTISPRGTHSAHIGTGNYTIMLGEDYMELLGVLQAIGLANNVMSHLGYELLPRWLLRVPLLRWVNTSTFHNLHHTSLRGNYALMFRGWDRLLGTQPSRRAMLHR